MEPAQASAATVVEPQAARKGMASFGVMWLGQFISLVGSRFTNFAFGLWIYEQTNSATAFSTLIFVSGLPGILLAPVAGALVDRWDRRKVMLGANVLNALASLTMVLILIARGGKLEWWYVYVYSAVGGLLQAFLWPAYMASTTLLMPKKHLARASGLVWLGMSFAGVLAPLPAPWLLETAGVAGIIWIDFATFLFAALSLVFVSIPAPQREAAAEAGADAAPKPAKPSLQGDIREGWAFIRARPGLFSLLLYFAMINLVFAMGSVLVAPMVLSFATRQTLAYITSAASLGFGLGSLVMTITGGPSKKIVGVLGFGLLLGLGYFLAGIQPAPFLIGTALFCAMFGLPVVNACSQAIWQVKTPPGLQGRVFAVRRMIATASTPVGQLLAGPLADYVFRPLLVAGGPLVASVGPILGVGPGRGIGLMYVLFSVLPIAASAWGFANPRVRNLETELADVI